MRKMSIFGKNLTKEIVEIFNKSDKVPGINYSPGYGRDSEAVRINSLEASWHDIDKKVEVVVGEFIKAYVEKHKVLEGSIGKYGIVDTGYVIESFKKNKVVVPMHSDFTLYSDGACTAFTIIILLSEGALNICSNNGSWIICNNQGIMFPDSPYFTWEIPAQEQDLTILSTHIVLKTGTNGK